MQTTMMSTEAKTYVTAEAVATETSATASATAAAAVAVDSDLKAINKSKWTDVQFRTVLFHSQPKRSFRVTIQRHESNVLIIEDNQTHEKWTCTIEHPSKHGPDMSMPNEAFVAALEAGLKQLDTVPCSSHKKAGGRSEKIRAEVAIDMTSVADEMDLTLRMYVSTFWEPEYTFHMSQVGLERVDLLVAQVRDLQELVRGYAEREHLRAASRLHLVCSDKIRITDTRTGLLCLQWASAILTKEAFFTLTDDNSVICVRNCGWYHIDALLYCGSVSQGYKYQLSVMLNGRSVGDASMTPATALSRTIYLREGDKLQIRDPNSMVLKESTLTIVSIE